MSDEVFEPIMLPEHEKRELCESLLQEFGVTRWRANEKKGELIHSCPIPGGHRNGDRNPSASINYRKLVFRCLGCGARGGFLWWIATCRGEDAEGVRDWLSGATGTGGHVMELPRLLEILEALETPAAPPPPIPIYPSRILEPWMGGEHHPLLTEAGDLGDGLHGRGIPPQTLDYFKIGYAPEYSMGPHSPTQERFIIPLFWKGALVGWQARRVAPWDEPKYKNSADFPRDRVIYNHHGFLTAVVVESPSSVLRHHHHIPELCATFGAAVAESQVRLLHRYSKVVLWFDNDEAGWDATETVGNALVDFLDVWAVENPYQADPADLDDSTAEELIAAAVPFVVWERPKGIDQKR